jgi:hypothetical protein
MVVVEPGATAPLTIDVENLGTIDDEVEVSVEGIDGEWIAIPVPIIKLKPGEKMAVKVFFKPPRFSESIAGNYPFVAKVRSLNDGDLRSAQGVLTIKPYYSLTLEVTPKKGFISPTKRQNIFTVSLMNMGNSEQMIQLTADDPEDVCAYEFDEEQVILAPGQQKDIDFLVNPKKGSPFGSSRLIGFVVTGRSLSTQSLVASSQGQLEIRPFFTPLNVSVIVATFLILMVLWFTQPKPPTIHLERTGNSKVYQGGMVTVHWVAEHATSVKLIAAEKTVKDNLSPEGTIEIPANLVGTLKIQAVAFRDKRQADSEIIEVDVEQPIVIPDPEIVQLKPTKDTVNKGEKFTLNYKFKNATKAVISPQGLELNQTFNSQQFDAGEVGENTFTVAAYNSAGKSVTKTFKVTVVDASLAKIIKFDVSPLEVDPVDGKVTINWHIETSVQVELWYTGLDPKKPYIVAAVGSKEIPIVGKTTFTLTAYDQNGKKITASKTVTIKQPDPAGGGNTPPTDGTTGTGGTTAGL